MESVVSEEYTEKRVLFKKTKTNACVVCCLQRVMTLKCNLCGPALAEHVGINRWGGCPSVLCAALDRYSYAPYVSVSLGEAPL